MIPDDEYIDIRELRVLINKSKKGKTVDEFETQTRLLNLIVFSTHVCRKGTTPAPLTALQTSFVTRLLKMYLLENIPKLEEVLQLYDLSIDDILVVVPAPA